MTAHYDEAHPNSLPQNPPRENYASEITTSDYFATRDRVLTASEVGEFSGRTFGVYRLEEELGRGGMGLVYKGVREDGELHMTVAIKLIRPKIADPEILTRFRRERQVLANLRHPNIALLLDVGTSQEGLPYFVMDYVDGTSIVEWCRGKTLTDKLQLFSKVLSAVSHAHRRGVVHRDIKPANVLVKGDGEPILLDFGIAHTIHGDGGKTKRTSGVMTPAYAAPEQLDGAVVSPRFDIFSLGLLLLEMCTGKRQSRKTEVAKVLPTSLRPQPPKELLELFLAALAEDPDNRYASCEQMAADLDFLIQNLTRCTLPDGKNSIQNGPLDAVIVCHHGDASTFRTVQKLLAAEDLKTLLVFDTDDHHILMMHLARTQNGIVCLGTSGNGPWLSQSVSRALEQRFQHRGLRLIPLLAPGKTRPDKESKLPNFLRGLVWFEAPNQDNRKDHLEPLIHRIRHGELPEELHGQDETCPFRGLEVFRTRDRHFFRGREALTQRLADHMSMNRFLAVLGPSGSGKSSVVQAGLMPILEERGYNLLLFTPTHRPLMELALNLFALFSRKGIPLTIDQIFRHMRQDHRALYLMSEDLADGSEQLCLVIDQFEEIFTLAHENENVVHFMANIQHALEHPESTVSLVLTLRSDFIGNCAFFKDFNNYVTEQMVQVAPMNRAQMTQAIVDPARMVGLRFEPGLVDTILDDLFKQDSELPLLEYALLELYERRQDRLLTKAAYSEIGGLEGALVQRAETLYESLDQERKTILRMMFTLCLVTSGEEGQDTRGRASMDQLKDIGGNHTENLVDHLVAARLVTRYQNDLHHTDQVDVAHEALIRKWNRIQSWMNEDRDIARKVTRLKRRAQAWHKGGRGNDYLLRGGQLYQMLELDERGGLIGETEKAYLQAGLTEERKAERKKRRTRSLIVAAIASGLLLFVITFFTYQDARRSTAAATEAAKLTRAAVSARLEANYSLSIAFATRATAALERENATEAWLGSLAALARDIPPDKDLPEPRGNFLDPRILAVERLLWTSPIAPKLAQIAMTTDGKMLALAGQDTLVRLVDHETGVQIAILSDANQAITDLAFSPDGRWLAAASQWEEVYLWHLPDNTFHQLARAHTGKVTSLCFSHDSSQLISGDETGTVQIASLGGPPSQKTLTLNRPINDLVISQYGEIYAATGKGIEVIDEATGRRRHMETTIEGEATRLDWHPKSGLVSGWQEGQILIHTGSNAKLATHNHSSAVIGLAYDSSGTHIISSSHGETKLWRKGNNRTLVDTSLRSLIVDEQTTTLGIDSNGHLSALSTEGSITEPALGHADSIWSVSYSPDGQWIASASFDGSVGLWSSDGTKQPHFLRGHTDRVYGTSFSPTGTQLATASYDKTIRIWDLSAGTSKVLQGHTDKVLDVAYSPDGSQLASASYDHSVRLWDPTTQTEQQVLTGHTSTVIGLSYAPDGAHLASAGYDKTIRIWDLARKTSRELIGHTGPVYSVAYSPDGKLIASGSYDGTIRLWDTESGQTRQVLHGHAATIYSVAFSPDGTRVASASFDHLVKLWHIDDTEPEMVLRGHAKAVHDVTFSPDGTRLLSASADQTMRMWQISELPSGQTLTGHTAPVMGVAFSPDGKRLASASADQTARLQTLPLGDANKGNERILSGYTGTVYSCAFSPDGRLLATGSDDRTVRIWNLETPTQSARTLQGHTGPVYGVDFSPDGKQVVSASLDKTARIWDLASGNTTRQLQGHTEGLIGVKFSPDGTQLATSSRDTTVRLWTETDEQPHIFRGHTKRVFAVAFSPDGTQLASASDDTTVRLWHVPQREPGLTLRGHAARVYGVTFSPDGTKLASTSADRTARIWNVADGRTLAVLQNPEGEVNWFPAFSPDGTLLATPGDDGSVRLWQMNKLLLPPPGTTSRDWYGELLNRSLYHFGYRLQGFNLIQQPPIRLTGNPSPYDHLDRPRPPEMDLPQWLISVER